MLVSIHPNSIPGTVWGRIRVQPPPGWEPCVSPGPAPRPLPNSESRLESRLARLWKLPRRSSEVSSFCPLASLCSSCATVWGNVPKGNPASCLFATPLLPVSFRNSWFLCPQILGFCQDPEWRNVLWVGAVGSAVLFGGLPLQSRIPSSSPWPSNRWSPQLRWPFVLLDRSTGQLRVIPYHLQQQIYFSL